MVKMVGKFWQRKHANKPGRDSVTRTGVVIEHCKIY